MRMSKKRYNLLKAAIKAVVEHFGPDKVREFGQETATDQLQYGDDHPFFQNGTWTRIHPHVDGFDMYKDDGHDCPGIVPLNDDHIDTALRKITAELHLC